MKNKQETFASLLQSHGYRYDLRSVFDDFLTITLCSFSRNVTTGLSYDEDLYMTTIGKYPRDMVRDLFPKLLASLITEMEECCGASGGNDVLGEFYELNFCRKGAGQFFTPWHICEMMARCNGGIGERENGHRSRVLDPSCGSGRMLMAGAKVFGTEHEYYAIDIDHTCVKMTALNLFLNGVFHGEVMCANALAPGDFRMSYVLSFLPFGIFRIENKEQSRLWHLHKNSFGAKKEKPTILLPSESGEILKSGASQLQLF